MKPVPRKVSASELRAKFGALLESVCKTGGELVITKRGKPVAKLVAITAPVLKTSPGIMKGKLRVRGDIVYVNLWEPVR